MRSFRLVLAAVVVYACDPSVLVAQARETVRGSEFAAAVNVPQKGVKTEGILFLPQKVARVQAVIVVIRYGLGGSSCCYYDTQWQKLAESSDAGLLLARFSSISNDSQAAVWNNASLGGADALLTLLQRFADESAHPELKEAPLLFWGHSAAGPFGATFAAMYPQRTIAFVRYHSGGVSADLKILSQIPALFFIGAKDTSFPQGALEAKKLWMSGRSNGAPWTLVMEPQAEHGNLIDVQKANDLMVPWTAAVLRQRLSSNGGSLRVVTDAAGWMGDHQSAEIAAYPAFAGSKAEGSWLPDEPSARAWSALVSTKQ